MSEKPATCELCGEPMPPGEEMFKYHGYSGPCPVPPLQRPRPCFIAGCGKPDVNAPTEQGTWPTCSAYPPACEEHLYLVPPTQRGGSR